jgi:hypothetical protein
MKNRAGKDAKARGECTLKFDPVALDSFFEVLDAIAWMSGPSAKQMSQFAALDPRTTGKVLKNGLILQIIEAVSKRFSLRLPYPYKGSIDEKKRS